MRKIFGILLGVIGIIIGVISFFLLVIIVVTGIGYIGKDMENEPSAYFSAFIMFFIILTMISVTGIIGSKKLLRDKE